MSDATTAPTVSIQTDVGPTIGFESDLKDTDEAEIHLQKTLVLVGCGKAKRDPKDEVDLYEAAVAPDEPMTSIPGAELGPAWRAEDLYTSNYFAAKRDFADLVTAWARGYDAAEWCVLSAEHGAVPNYKPLKPYDTTIGDLGDDPTNPEHRVSNPFGRRRPDGQEIVTEMDQWAARVASGLSKWVASFRERKADPWENDANELLVLAGQKYVEPLRERGVFEYGISRMAGNPNEGWTFPLRPRFLFDEIPAGGNGEQMGWLSDAVSRLEPVVFDSEDGTQEELGSWTGNVRTCVDCGVPATGSTLSEFGGNVYCRDCEPIGRCNRCNSWTHETGLGAYPLCPDCQTQYGGQKNEPLEDAEPTEQKTLTGANNAD